jgi:hypothetical protein
VARPLLEEAVSNSEKGGASMVPILLWLLGVPIGLILILLLLGVVHF